MVASTMGRRSPRITRGMQPPSASFRGTSQGEGVMILPLRQRHRRLFAVLAALLPSLFFVGIAARRAVSQPETLPPELSPGTAAFTPTGYESDGLFGKSPVRLRLLRNLD